MSISQIVIQFILSGAVVVAATLVAKLFDSKWAGLLVALPVLTVLGFIFISMNTSSTVTQKFLLSALIFMIPAAVYLLSLYLLFGRVNLPLSIVLAIIPFGIMVIIVQRFL